MSIFLSFLVLLYAASAQAEVMRAHLAGSWYPAEVAALTGQLRSMEWQAEARYAAALSPRVLIVPHAGYRYSGVVASSVYRLLRSADIKRVIILAPSHYVGFSGVRLPSFDSYETSLGSLAVDLQAIEQLRHKKYFSQDAGDDVYRREHSLEVQLPFIQFYSGNVLIVPLMVGDVTDAQAREIAAALRPLLNRETVLVVSSDFTHYGSSFQFTPFDRYVRQQIKQLDAGAVAAIEQKSLSAFSAYMEQTHATICGSHAIRIMLGMLGATDHAYLIAYATSADADKTVEQSVSYLGLAFSEQKRTELPLQHQITMQEQRELLQYARATIAHVLGSRMPASSFAPIPSPLFQEYRGAFVTVYKKGQLRGCIGRVIADQPLLQTVGDMAIASATQDSRFAPLTYAELADVTIAISVLTRPYRVTSYRTIVLGRHGIILKVGKKSALFLPHVATEQGWTLETTLTQLSLKAGLTPDAWRNEYAQFEVFEAIDFKE